MTCKDAKELLKVHIRNKEKKEKGLSLLIKKIEELQIDLDNGCDEELKVYQLIIDLNEKKEYIIRDIKKFEGDINKLCNDYGLNKGGIL